MLKIAAEKYFLAGMSAQDARTSLMLLDSEVKHGGSRAHIMKDGPYQDIIQSISNLRTIAEALDLKISVHLLSCYYSEIPETEREFDVVLQAMRAELKNINLLFVPSERAKYYEAEWSENLIDGFPVASQELSEAGRCFAMASYTASVFHSMRAAEIGMRALGAALNVTFPDKPTDMAEWHQILDQAEKNIKSIGQQPRSQQRASDQEFYSQAASQFRFFKDGWRVRVAHAHASYNEQEALRVLEHVRDFLGGLSPRLAEPGQ